MHSFVKNVCKGKAAVDCSNFLETKLYKSWCINSKSMILTFILQIEIYWLCLEHSKSGLGLILNTV